VIAAAGLAAGALALALLYQHVLLIIARVGLLAGIALLMTHFALIRTAVTTDVSSWRFTTGAVQLTAFVACGFLAAAIAAGRFQTPAHRQYSHSQYS
jgi:hypothetical protein